MKMQELLTIDPQFKNLIPPLQRTEYLQLEENLLADGCRDPLVVWRGTLIDGHNRYEICTRHSIPFSVKEMNFYCREEAIAWICWSTKSFRGNQKVSDWKAVRFGKVCVKD